MPYTVRKHLPRQMTRSCWTSQLLDALESRVLLSDTLTWIGPASGESWSTAADWVLEDGTTHRAPLVGDDVVFNGNATVEMDSGADYDVHHQLNSLTVEGNASVVLNFDHNGAVFNVANNIILNQTASHGASLELGIFNANANSITASITADGLVATGNTSGWASLIVDPRTSLTLVADLNNVSHTVLHIADNGSITCDYAELLGKNLTDASNIVANGTFSVVHTLDVGGYGIVNFSANGQTNVHSVLVANGATLDVPSGAILDVSYGAIILGNDTGHSVDVDAGAGAQLNIHNGGVVSANHSTGVVLIDSGDGASIKVTSGAHLYSNELDILPSTPIPNISSSCLLVDGTGTTVDVAGAFKIGAGIEHRGVIATGIYYSPPSGKAIVSGGAIVTIGGAASVTGLTVDRGIPGNALVWDQIALDVSGGSQFQAQSMTISNAFVKVWGSGTFLHTTSTSSVFTAGATGAGSASLLEILPGATVNSASPIHKLAGTTFSGGGTIVAGTSTTAGVWADIAGGDYLLGRTEEGNLINNGTNATDTFGTLTIDYNLDASAGFTLDSVLGSSNTSNLLAVTGTVTLGGDFAGQFAAITDGVDSTTFTTSNSFTILTAAAIIGLDEDSDPIVGGFGDYSFGDPIVGDRYLPVLADNYYWTLKEVTDGSNTDLQLAVGSLTLSATANTWHSIVLATNAPTWFPTHLSIESGDDTSFKDVSPGYATTISSWTAPSNLYSGQTNSYRVTADIDGQTFWATASATTLTNTLRPSQPTSFAATVDGSDATAIDFTAANNTDSGYDQIQMASAAAPTDWFDLDGPTLTTTATVESGARIFPDMLFRTCRITNIDGTHSDASPWSSTYDLNAGSMSTISTPTLTSMIAIPGGYRLTINGVPELSGGGPGSGVYIEDLSDGFNYKLPQQQELSLLRRAA